MVTIELVQEPVEAQQRRDALAALEELWKSATVRCKEPPLSRDQLHERS
jgi:hypothetical protein